MAESYRFPLNRYDEYPAHVSFEAFEEDYQSLLDLGTSVVEDNVDPGILEDIGENVKEFLDKWLGNDQETIQNNEVNRPVGVQGKVQLYLPQAIQIADKIDYGPIDLGILGASAFALTQAANQGRDISVRRITAESVSSIVGGITRAISGDLGTVGAQLGIQRVMQGVGRPEVAGAVASAAGIAVNPNRRNIMQGISLRAFRFTFKMIPTSASEAREIKNIIKFFRTSMYPTLLADAQNLSIFQGVRTTQGLSAGLAFPRKFNIRMFYELADSRTSTTAFRQTEEIATGILPCFLESFDAVYNPNAMAYHEDGNPQEIDINMNFIEERPVTREDITTEQDGISRA